MSVVDFQTLPEIGSEIDIFISRLDSRDGSPVISYTKARDIMVWKNADENFKSKKHFVVKIAKK